MSLSKIYFLIAIFLNSLSCLPNNDESAKSTEQINEQIQKIETIKKFVLDDYKIRFSLDTVNFIYSYQYETILESEYQLISEFLIKDITRFDSIITFHIVCGEYINIHLDLSIKNNKRVQTVIDSIDSNQYYDNYLFVASVEELKKVDFLLYLMEADEDFGIEQPTLYIDDIMGETFYGKGEIVEIKTY